VLARYPRSRIAVVFVNDDYGRPLRGVFVERLRAGGVTPVYDSPYGESDIATEGGEMVAALSRAQPDLFIWIGRAPEFIAIHAQLKQALPRLAVVASDGFSGSSVANDTLHALDGVSYVRLMDAHRRDPELERLRADYKRERWGEPGDQDVLSYDAVMLLAEAMRNVGAHREAIRDWLARVGHDLPPVQGLSGPIAFASGGDRRPQYFIEEIGKARLDSARH
jgi:ABC-type branched-subunit amino acid transport system substrate-binding protein